MYLYIDTTLPEEMIIALREREKNLAQRRVKAARRQGEKLIPAIASLLKAKKKKLSDLKKIVVVDRGGSFTSLRIGVITANALAYALRIPVEPASGSIKKGKSFSGFRIVEPVYDREPNIGRHKPNARRDVV